jgi:hypothetical protein
MCDLVFFKKIKDKLVILLYFKKIKILLLTSSKNSDN